MPRALVLNTIFLQNDDMKEIQSDPLLPLSKKYVIDIPILTKTSYDFFVKVRSAARIVFPLRDAAHKTGAASSMVILPMAPKK